MNEHKPQAIVLAVTGASGIQYTLRLLECLVRADKKVYFLMSQAAHAVANLEMDLKLPAQTNQLKDYLVKRFSAKVNQLEVFASQEWTAPIASGSNAADAMIVCPCSMGCLSAIATGASNNLVERAADVVLKEKRKLILVTRETPLSTVHLENMLRVAQAGGTILPANPGFYHKPQTVDALIDFIVARILDHIQVPHQLLNRWG